METLQMHQTKSPSKAALRAGWIITVFCTLFLLFDAIMKIIREAHSIKGSVELGWPDSAIVGMGLLLLACTILYILPRTAILGAILLTAYLGGATAIMVRVGAAFAFPVIFGMLVWLGLYLRSGRLRQLVSYGMTAGRG